MREGWEYQKLSNLASCYIGLTYKPTDVVTDGGIIVLRSSNIQDNKLDFNDIVRVKCEVNPNKFVRKGDILMCSRNGSFRLVGKVAEIKELKEPMTYGAFMTIIRSDSGRFLFYFFQSDSFRRQLVQGQTATINQITTKMLSNISLYVPPFSEQERIVSELDLLSSIIEKKKAQLEEYDQLAQSIFYDMFGDPVTNEKGWEVKKLGDVCEPKKVIKRASNCFKQNEQINYIDISSIDNSQNKIVSTTPYVFGKAPSRAQQVVIKGDILLSLVRPNLKNIAMVLEDDDKLVASSGFCILRTIPVINNKYLFYVVLGDLFTNHLLGRVQGANYPAVREDDVKNYILPLPPLSLQQQFAEKIEAIEKQKEQIKQSIAEVETLFNSRMDYYFN